MPWKFHSYVKILTYKNKKLIKNVWFPCQAVPGPGLGRPRCSNARGARPTRPLRTKPLKFIVQIFYTYPASVITMW